MAKKRENKPAKIVVIGGSHGAIEALLDIVPAVPADVAAALFVVVHIPSDASSYLPNMLTRAGNLRAAHPADREPIRSAQIYVAPPDHHLTIEDGEIHARRGPRENRHRPAIDPLFRTAARAYGPDLIAVILSGNLDDGSAGLLAVKSCGGTAIVQDPSDARAAEMPKRALEYAGADYVLPVRQIGPKIVELLGRRSIPVKKKTAHNKAKKNGNSSDPEVTEHEHDFVSEQGNGKPSVFACPECHGVLWEKKQGNLARFRCRVGHSYTADALKGELGDATERALWAAMRALEEKAAMSRRVMGNAKGPRGYVERLKEQAEGDSQNAELLRKMIFAED
jgi:two-component system chemotaxis response regulator CheB